MLKTLIRGNGSTAATGPPPATAPAAAAICDQHGGALLMLAAALAGDRPAAETAVVEVIGASFPIESMAVPMAATEMRRHLARRVYLKCRSREVAGVADVQYEQVALALIQHGKLSYRAVADLLGLSAEQVARHLAGALRHCSGSGPAARTR
ncbi:hypothetical protein ACI2LF_23910 [Kribbella sp. NPDC020789]